MDREIDGLRQQQSSNEAQIARLSQFNACLRQKIKHLDKSAFTTCYFLDLPRELRNAVYRLCIAPGKVFPRTRSQYDRRHRDMEQYSEPEWQLFGVNRQVRNEAAEIFFMENQIVLNCIPNVAPLLGGSLAREPLAAHVALHHMSAKFLTSLSVSFDHLSLMANLVKGSYNVANAVGENPLRILSTPQLQEHVDAVHSQHSAEVMEWREFMWRIAPRTSSLGESQSLRFLQVDVTNCLCVNGCCRMIDQAAMALASGQFGRRLERIEILGTRTQAERDVFIAHLLEVCHPRAEACLAISQPVLFFKVFAGEDVDWEKRYIRCEGLDVSLGDEEVDLKALCDEQRNVIVEE